MFVTSPIRGIVGLGKETEARRNPEIAKGAQGVKGRPQEKHFVLSKKSALNQFRLMNAAGWELCTVVFLIIVCTFVINIITSVSVMLQS